MKLASLTVECSMDYNVSCKFGFHVTLVTLIITELGFLFARTVILV